MSADDEARRAVEAVWRVESARVIGGLVRRVRDLERAEDLAQHALLRALETWPASGIPDNPGAWLVTAALHRATDEARRARLAERKLAEHGAVDDTHAPEPASVDPTGGDDVLRLMLLACHPVLSRDARAALVLRLVAGLETAEIARAFLASEPTIAQRIVRAKRTLAEARAPFELPEGPALEERVEAVLDVVYLLFNEGYAATSGSDWTRPSLCEEALRLGRRLAAIAPAQAEAHGLVALMELQASRLAARRGPNGEAVPLGEQRRSSWDGFAITRGRAALARADALGGPRGVYTLQAAIALCHAGARAPGETPWETIVALYDALAELTGSPVVELNRAVAVAMAFGPEAGLAIVDELRDEPALATYHHVPSVRADLLAKLGRHDEAREELERAAALVKNDAERALLLARADASARRSPR